MKRVGAVLLLLIFASAAAQDERMPGESAPDEETVSAPPLAVLVHHPFPDASDPLGVEYLQTGSDAYWHRYKHLDTDGVSGFDFPHTVFDGIVAIEGIPEGDGPYVATRDAYQAAYDSRIGVEAPIEMSAGIFGWGADGPNVALYAYPEVNLSSEDLWVWVAIVEDPVHYEPPPALSNGVFVHPFVVRGVVNAGPIDDVPQLVHVPLPAGASSDEEVRPLRAVAWVQQGPSDGLRFDAHEVVQAVMEVPGQAQTVTTQKVVLMEMYSATWCDTCLFGDRVAEEMAESAGVERDLEPESTGYLRDGPWLLMVAGGLVAGLAVALPRLPGRRP